MLIHKSIHGFGWGIFCCGNLYFFVLWHDMFIKISVWMHRFSSVLSFQHGFSYNIFNVGPSFSTGMSLFMFKAGVYQHKPSRLLSRNRTHLQDLPYTKCIGLYWPLYQLSDVPLDRFEPWEEGMWITSEILCNWSCPPCSDPQHSSYGQGRLSRSKYPEDACNIRLPQFQPSLSVISKLITLSYLSLRIVFTIRTSGNKVILKNVSYQNLIN